MWHLSDMLGEADDVCSRGKSRPRGCKRNRPIADDRISSITHAPNRLAQGALRHHPQARRKVNRLVRPRSRQARPPQASFVLELVFLIDLVGSLARGRVFLPFERSRNEGLRARRRGFAGRRARRPPHPIPRPVRISGAARRVASDRHGCDRSDRRSNPARARW